MSLAGVDYDSVCFYCRFGWVCWGCSCL